MKENTKHLLGDAILLSVAFIWGLGFVAVKIGLNDGMSPFFLMTLRFGVAALALLPLQWKKRKLIKKETFKHGSLLGFFMFLGFAFQTFGLQYTTTSKNAFLTGVNVILVPFLTWFFLKKKIPLRSAFAALLSLIGMGLLTLNDDLSINIGDLLTIVCAVMFAAHITMTSVIAKNDSAMSLVLIQMITATLLSFVMTLIIREPWSLTPSSSLAILYLGIFSTMLAFVLQTVGQRFAHATKAAILLSAESLFGAFFGVVLFHDAMSPRMLLGAGVIFLGILLAEL
ncbi:MAG: DMT family transporter [Vallitaleaceae bacterium]|nr:DMT family transporter [Vallitaleaceae bacterium]